MNVRHHKVGEADEPAVYRINDDLVILLIMSFEFSKREKHMQTISLLTATAYAMIFNEGIFDRYL